MLLLNGVVASSFTQADINNGLVSYQATMNGVASDTLSFKIVDAAGNTTGISSFQINITPFDALEYLASNPDLISAFGLNLTAATNHYFSSGINEHRATHSFDAYEYLASNTDLILAFGPNTALGEQHYVANGFNEHRATNSFDAMEYLASNPDLIQAFGQYGIGRAALCYRRLQRASRHELVRPAGVPRVQCRSDQGVRAEYSVGRAALVASGFNEHRATNSFDPLEYLASNPDLILTSALILLSANSTMLHTASTSTALRLRSTPRSIWRIIRISWRHSGIMWWLPNSTTSRTA